MIKFNEDLEAYTLEIDGILFSWEEEPEGDYESEAQTIAENYKNNLSKIIDFISEDIREVYGDMELEEIKENLGKPIIDIHNGQVTYCEQTFDDIHIFSFEFLDNEFSELQYFGIDG